MEERIITATRASTLILRILNDIRRTIYEMIDSRYTWVMDDGLRIMDYGLWWNVCGQVLLELYRKCLCAEESVSISEGYGRAFYQLCRNITTLRELRRDG